jgi:riboflavin biosynthesis pyrimidine reductase
LIPDVLDVGDLVAYEAGLDRPASRDRPWVLCNMVSSADGAIDVGGVSGPLGGAADKAVFRALRAVADVILVGASTVRHERYHPPRSSDDVVAVRRARGQANQPRLAVVTSRGQLDPGLGLFADPGNRPFVITTTAAGGADLAPLASVSEVVVAGDDRVDLAVALAHVSDAGARVVLVEGGPTINGQLLALDLVDEWRLTLSPMLVAGASGRAATGPAPDPPHRFLLDRLLVAEDLVFLRYLRR